MRYGERIYKRSRLLLVLLLSGNFQSHLLFVLVTIFNLYTSSHVYALATRLCLALSLSPWVDFDLQPSESSVQTTHDNRTRQMANESARRGSGGVGLCCTRQHHEMPRRVSLPLPRCYLSREHWAACHSTRFCKHGVNCQTHRASRVT